jgi:hypothetical protein
MSNPINNEEKNIQTLIFEDVESLKGYVGLVPQYLPNLLNAISPCPVEYLLNRYQNDQIIEEIIVSIYPKNNFIDFNQQNRESQILTRKNEILAFPDSTELISSGENKSPIITQNRELSQQILPTLIDCRDWNVVKILRPGLISYADLKLLLPRKIFLIKDYFSYQSLNFLDLFKIYNKPNTKSKVVVLGTKENLKIEFDLWFLRHFQLYRKDNFTLINIGSQTNPENIIKQLGKNLMLAKEEAAGYIYFLNQSWPQSQWGEILRFIISNISKPLPEKPKRVRAEKLIAANRQQAFDYV